MPTEGRAKIALSRLTKVSLLFLTKIERERQTMSIDPTLSIASAPPLLARGRDSGGFPAFDTGQPSTAASRETPAAIYAPSGRTPTAQTTYRPTATIPAPTGQATDWASDSLLEAASGTIIAIALGQPVMLTKFGADLTATAASQSVLPTGPRPQAPSLPRDVSLVPQAKQPPRETETRPAVIAPQ